MVEIHKFRYMVEMGCGLDAWRPTGQVYGHPNVPDGNQIYTSTPVSLDEENLRFKTASGREYQIITFDDDQKKILDQIKTDIKNQGTEMW